MQPFTKLTAGAAPLMRANVDTDIIIPIERNVMCDKADMHRYAFEPLRFGPGGGDSGEENPEFPLNQPRFRDAQVLITGPNFGCGSSREAAVWAVGGLGIRAIIGSSFGNIFMGNCFQNGILPIVLDAATVDQLAEIAEAAGGAPFTVDLEAQTIRPPNGEAIPFDVEPNRRQALLEGLDDTGMTLKHETEISEFQSKDREARPWVYLQRD